MLGSLLDKTFVACSHKRGALPSQIEHHAYKHNNSSPNWVCFIPEFCYRVPFLRNCLIQEGVNVDLYVLPSATSAVQSNPKLTCKFLDDVLVGAIQRQKQNYYGKKVNVMGISLGNVLAYRFAENFRVDKLFSVVPGSRLAECIWESIATNSIAKNSGRSLQDYQEALAGYNPIESASKIKPSYTEIHLGLCDLMIPYFRGNELAKKMKSKFNTKVECGKYSGHVETIISFSIKFPKIASTLS